VRECSVEQGQRLAECIFGLLRLVPQKVGSIVVEDLQEGLPDLSFRPAVHDLPDDHHGLLVGLAGLGEPLPCLQDVAFDTQAAGVLLVFDADAVTGDFQ
jgi:hypothetical protein